MRINIRKINDKLIPCLEIHSVSYDIQKFLEILSNQRHPFSSLAKKLLMNKLVVGNILCTSNSIDILKKIEDLLLSYLLNGDLWIVKDAIVDDNIEYLPPIVEPPLMFGLAGNCPQTWRGSGQAIPNYPVGYTRPLNSLVGHKKRVFLSEKTVTSFRCAAELGVVIGKEAYKVKAENAFDYIFGYTVVNDMISNYWKDFAAKENPNNSPSFEELLITSYYGRGTDCFGPIGSSIVSKEEVGDPYNLLITTYVNGVQRDRSYTNAMIVGIEQTIEYLSSFMPLYPGSIIHMGTMGLDGITISNNEILSENDYVEMKIERVGTLKTYFKDGRKGNK